VGRTPALSHPDPRFNLPRRLEKAGRVDETIAGYRTVLEGYPEYVQLIEALTKLQIRSGRVDKNTAYLLSEIALHGKSERWHAWA
jgi:hypothetical protein